MGVKLMAEGWRAPSIVLLRIVLAAGATLFLALPWGASAEEGSLERVLMATTTSTANSGLLDALLPAFEDSTGISVDFVAVGSGAALKLAENGDVDVVLIHAPEEEEEFVRNGYGIERVPLMHNDFVVLGPRSDPASIAGSTSVIGAFSRIAAHGLTAFITRGDESGTHVRERAIWQAAGLAPAGDWYLDAGQGMAACLGIADEKGGYILSDRGTYLAMQDDLEIAILFEGDSLLVNPYSLIAVPPQRRPDGNYEGALRLIAWLTSTDGQERIAAFRVGGEMLFHPDVVKGEEP